MGKAQHVSVDIRVSESPSPSAARYGGRSGKKKKKLPRPTNKWIVEDLEQSRITEAMPMSPLPVQFAFPESTK